MREGKILIVDNDPGILLSLQTILEQHYTDVRTLESPVGIPDQLNHADLDVVLLDMNCTAGDTSGKEGMEWLEKILKLDPCLSVVPIIAPDGVSAAVEAMETGAVDFIVKPWQDEKTVCTVSAAYQLCQSKRDLDRLKRREKILLKTIDDTYPAFIGNSSALKGIMALVNKVAATNANILILGENGTGKELVAREIHRRSERRDKALITVDLASVSESSFESVLFGHQKESFTDALEERIGRFEAAHEGTLFLDEIGNLPYPLQSKLLTVIQNRTVYRRGSTKAAEVDIRLISAANQNIVRLVEEGSFRQDLLYRINTVEIRIPALRERIDDIPLLMDNFLIRYRKKYRKPGLKIPESVIRSLQKYPWPGNVRELQHSVERAVIMSDGKIIKTEDFQSGVKKVTAPLKEPDYNIERLEKTAVMDCLKKHRGNVTKTALELGLTRGALYRRMQKYGF